MDDRFAVQAAIDLATSSSTASGVADPIGFSDSAAILEVEGRSGRAEEIPYESSVCSFSLRKNGVQISNNAVYFGRTFLSCGNVTFGQLSSTTTYYFARVEHSSASNMKLSIVRANNMTLGSTLAVTYRLLWSARLKSGTWGRGNSRFEVVDYRCIPQIPAYT